MKLTRNVSIILLTAGLAALVGRGNAQNVDDQLQVARSTLKADRKATLQFQDGSTRTVAARPDVDLTLRKVGEEVVIRVTEMVAIGIEKP